MGPRKESVDQKIKQKYSILTIEEKQTEKKMNKFSQTCEIITEDLRFV